VARLPFPSEDELSDATRAQLVTRPPVHLYRMVANAPAVLGPFMAMVRTNFTQLSLADDLREMVILRVAMHHRSGYEIFHHRTLAQKAGVSAADIKALLDGDAGFQSDTAGLCDVVAFVDESLQDARPSDPVFQRVAAALGNRATVELALLIGFYRMVATFIAIVDLEPETPAA
jgi:4-carboxymuconolactone decarboxylase